MTPDEARSFMAEAQLHVDFVNLGRVVSALQTYTWKTFDRMEWRPDKHLAIKEAEWLAKHAGDLYSALRALRDMKG